MWYLARLSAWQDIDFDINEIVEVFGGVAVRRAQTYLKKITGLRDSDWPITARVEGGELYATRLVLKNEEDLTSQCTCPVGANCKHGAALAIHLTKKAANGVGDRSDRFVSALGSAGKDLADWLARFERAQRPEVSAKRRLSDVLFFLTEDSGELVLEIRQARILRDGSYGKPRELRDPSSKKELMRSGDDRLIQSLTAFRKPGPTNYSAFAMGAYDGTIIRQLVDTGRLFWQENRFPIRYGEPRSELPVWMREGEGYRLAFASGHRVLAALDPHYLDTDNGLIGLLDLPLNATQVKALADAPEVPAKMWKGMDRSMSRLFGRPLEVFGGETEEEQEVGVEEVALECAVTMSLVIANQRWGEPEVKCEAVAIYRNSDSNSDSETEVRFGLCEFGDDDPPGRDVLAETERLHELIALTNQIPTGYFDDVLRERVARVSNFVADRVIPKLRSTGWNARMGDGFTAVAPVTDARWIEDLSAVGDSVNSAADQDFDAGASWFSYSLGVEIDGKSYSLLPILVKALRDPSIELSLAELARGGGDGITVSVNKKTRLYIPRERLVAWLRPLLELELRGLNEEGELRLAAPLVVEIANEAGELTDQRTGTSTQVLLEALQASSRA